MRKQFRKIWLVIGIALIAVGVLSLVPNGGNLSVTDENYQLIKPGMTQDEVEKLLGPATFVRTGHKAVWESMSDPPRFRANDNPDLYESRIYVGRIDKKWHQNTVRVAFREGDGVIKVELFESHCPTLPQQAVVWIERRFGKDVVVGHIR